MSSGYANYPIFPLTIKFYFKTNSELLNEHLAAYNNQNGFGIVVPTYILKFNWKKLYKHILFWQGLI